jgi:hypothetical protein
MVGADDFHAELVAEADDFLNGDDAEVYDSDGDGKLRDQRLEFRKGLHNEYGLRDGLGTRGKTLGTGGIGLQNYDRVVHGATPRAVLGFRC